MKYLLEALLAVCLSAPVMAAGAPLKAVGITVSDLGNPYFVDLAESAEDEAHRLGGAEVRVSVVSSAYDLRRQVSQIDRFIAEKMNLILLTAADPHAIKPAVLRARAAGIKVIAVDVDADGADATVTTDNVQAGRIACAYLARRLDGRGNVVIINGPPVSAVTDRIRGCKTVFSRFPGIHLLSDDQNGGGSREGGLEKMTDLLTAYDHIDGVFAENDPTAVGAELAARQAQRHFVIVSVDGSPAVQEQLESGDSMIAATAAQSPGREARMAVRIGYALLNGKAPAHRVNLIPAKLVTKKNVAAYKGWNDP